MGMPMIIGAGVGALGSAAMGKSPFTGALLGGTLGGLGGAGGLFGASSSGGIGGLAASTPEVAADLAVPSTSLLSGTSALPSLGIPASAYGAAPMGIELGAVPTSQALGEGLSYAISPSTIGLGGATTAMQPYSPTLMDKLSTFGSNTFDWMKANPTSTLGAAKMFADVKNQPKQQMTQAPSAGVSKGGNIQYQPINTGEIPQFKYPHSLLLGY